MVCLPKVNKQKVYLSLVIKQRVYLSLVNKVRGLFTKSGAEKSGKMSIWVGKLIPADIQGKK